MIKIRFSMHLNLLLLAVFSSTVMAVQPMTESDLEIVSAKTGKNILNIFGASQAGLRIDEESGELMQSSVTLSQEKFSEGEATKPIALTKLRDIEADSFDNTAPPQQPVISNDSQSTVLTLNKSTQGSASIFETDSEINYKNSNVHHDMRTIDDGGVAIARELQIDLLKLENLQGDNTQSGRNAGNIYLSDWISRGDTRIISTQ